MRAKDVTISVSKDWNTRFVWWTCPLCNFRTSHVWTGKSKKYMCDYCRKMILVKL